MLLLVFKGLMEVVLASCIYDESMRFIVFKKVKDGKGLTCTYLVCILDSLLLKKAG